MFRSVFTALLCSFLPSLAHADTHAYETWLGGFVNGPLSGKWLFQGDLHYRAYADFSPNWVLVRPGIGYQLAPGMNATLGYAWTPSWPKADLGFDDRIDEQRIFEQWQYEFPIVNEKLKLQLRSRLEQRWRPSVAKDTGLRFRQMVRVSVPLNERYLLAFWDEFFLGFNNTSWGQHAGFDQNRAFFGFGWWAALGRLRFEVGYFNQYLLRSGNAQGNLSNHAAMLNSYVAWK